MKKVAEPKQAVKPLKYQQLLQQSQQEKDQQALEFQVEEAKQQLEADILATKRSLASSRQDLLKAKSAQPFDAQKIINIQIRVEGLEDGLSRLLDLMEELF